jgi:hypothetical protein
MPRLMVTAPILKVNGDLTKAAYRGRRRQQPARSGAFSNESTVISA